VADVIPIVVNGDVLVSVGPAEGALGPVKEVMFSDTETLTDPTSLELPANDADPAIGPAVPLELWLITKDPLAERGKYGLPITPLPKS
jgi:hypothetical protein